MSAKVPEALQPLEQQQMPTKVVVVVVIIWIHFMTLLVLDPVLKLQYLNVAWEKKYLSAGVESFKTQVICSLFVISSTNK